MAGLLTRLAIDSRPGTSLDQLPSSDLEYPFSAFKIASATSFSIMSRDISVNHGSKSAHLDRSAGSSPPKYPAGAPSEGIMNTHEKVTFPISWDGENDSTNPRNWPKRDKWMVTVLFSTFSFTTMTTSTMVAPALPQIARDLRIPTEAETQLVLSVYVLSYAFGPLLLAPLSEIYGRIIILQIASTWFLLWNVICGFAGSEALMVTGRVMSGVGASAALAMSSGILSDCWRPEERGHSLSVYTMIPLLGPCIGPIGGAYMTQHWTWRWIFWSTSILSAFIQGVSIFLLRESHAQTILRRKAFRLQKATGIPSQQSMQDSRSTMTTLGNTLCRPMHLLLSQPVLQFMALLSAVSFGILYIILASIPSVFKSQYEQSTSAAALNYISLGAGFAVGAQSFGSVSDAIHRRQRIRSTPKPELRIILILPAIFMCAIGLCSLGWSAQTRTHWLVSDVGIALFGIGNQMATQSMNAYIIDVYEPLGWSASAMAGVWTAKSLAGFGFPLLATLLYREFGWGWGNSLLAVVILAVGGPTSVALWWCGEKYRRVGARSSLSGVSRNSVQIELGNE